MRALAIAALLVAGCGGGDAQIDARLERLDALPVVDGPCEPGCNPLEQIGCTDRCTYVHRADGRFPVCYLSCADTPGSIPLGGTCTPNVGGYDDCVVGAVCRVDTCVAFCALGSLPCASGLCPVDEFACSLACDPTAPSCPDGQQCVGSLYPEEGPGCVPVGDLPEGAPCLFVEECGPGLACFRENPSSRRCLPMCLVAGAPCAAGTCTPRDLGDAYGVCL